MRKLLKVGTRVKRELPANRKVAVRFGQIVQVLRGIDNPGRPVDGYRIRFDGQPGPPFWYAAEGDHIYPVADKTRH